METVVVSLGGSILIPGENDAQYLNELAKMIRGLCKDKRIFLVCGGGKIARYYIQTGRELKVPVNDLDLMGIGVTRLNALLVRLALGETVVNEIPETVGAAKFMAQPHKVVVMGGTIPGHTTDAVAAMLAEATEAARIVNATSVDAAYTADPKKDPTAQRLKKITYQDLYDLVNKGVHGAGPSDVFDRKGADIALRHHIPIFIVNGRNLQELQKAILGQDIEGTVVGE